jgi:hypothetical protein
MPSVPNVMVLLDAGKSFEAFQADDAICRQRAGQQTGTTSNNAVNENPAVGAALGALAGAGLVAVIGAASGQAGPGAAIGACSGLLFGTALAAGPASSAGQEVQRRYDNAYQQRMYAKGNQVPGTMRGSYRTYGAIPLLPSPPYVTPGPPVFATPPPPAGEYPPTLPPA